MSFAVSHYLSLRSSPLAGLVLDIKKQRIIIISLLNARIKNKTFKNLMMIRIFSGLFTRGKRNEHFDCSDDQRYPFSSTDLFLEKRKSYQLLRERDRLDRHRFSGRSKSAETEL